MACTIANPCPVANITYVSDWFTYSNTVTAGAFGFVLMAMVFIVTFIGMRNFPMKQSLPASLFITTSLGSLLAAAGIVGQEWIFGLLAATVAATVMLNVSRDS